MFTFSESFHLDGSEKGTDRTSTLSPLTLWFAGEIERGAVQNKRAAWDEV